MSNSPDPPTASTFDELVAVVGVGASAGGLEALNCLFRSLPAGTGLAFVVLQHQDPLRKSHLVDLLGNVTTLPVLLVLDRTRILADHIYVCPPGAAVTIRESLLCLQPSVPRHPIDEFLDSLAKGYKERSVAVILSGSGNDGTLGVQAIREAGGLVLAQDGASFTEMPRSALNSGSVDAFIACEAMASRLALFAQSLEDSRADSRGSQPLDDETLRHVCSVLLEQTGHDFSNYKVGTLSRRILRRVRLRGMTDLLGYLQYLQEDKTEADRLLKDLLIGLTHFFRDKDVFLALAKQVIPHLFEGKKGGDTVRVWVPGCASGEEAYSIAMLLLEYAEAKNLSIRPQIFGTDLDVSALDTARSGIYPSSISEQISPERLSRFFISQGESYQINRQLREACIFSVHSLTRDPPFSNMDLVSCRNVLIYFDTLLQQKVFHLLHYALRTAGYLFLGPSESASAHGDLFEGVDQGNRIYQARQRSRRIMVDFPVLPTSGRVSAGPGEFRSFSREQVLGRVAERILLEHYTPTAAVVTEDGTITCLSGQPGRYLDLPVGAANMNLFNLARKAVGLTIRSTLNEAIRLRQAVTQDAGLIDAPGGPRKVTIVVRPMPEGGSGPSLFLVVFQDAESHPNAQVTQVVSSQESVIQQLESELVLTRERLVAAMSEFEDATEQLQTSNEELLSMNEELHSANEELQTSQEELQSANEELLMVNTELERNITELNQARSDLQNLLESTQLAVLILDGNWILQQWTPAAKELFHLHTSDLGRSLSELDLPLPLEELLRDCEAVFSTLQPRSREVLLEETKLWCLLHIRPYTTIEGRTAGIVLSFVDVTATRKAQEHEAFLASMVESSHDAIFAINPQLEIIEWNPASMELYGYAPDEIVGKSIQVLWPENRWGALRGQVYRALHGDRLQALEDIRLCKDGTEIDVSVTFSPIYSQSGQIIGVSSTARDISERKKAEITRQEFDRRLQETQKLESLGVLAGGIAHDFNNLLTIILGHASLAGNQLESTSGIHSHIKQIEEAGHRAADLCRQMLAYAGKGKFTFELVDLNILLRDISSLLLHAVNKNITFTIREMESPLPVMADTTQLRQVIMNLVVNASEALGENQGIITVLTGAMRIGPAIIARSIPGDVLSEGEYAYLEVWDTGPGISDETKSRIFEPFFSTKFAGRGLGLSAVLGILRRHRGALTVDTALHQGARFRVYLPLSGENLLSQHLPEVSPLWHGSGQVLIIDDEDQIRNLARAILHHMGFSVVEARDGVEGVERFSQTPDAFVLVLVDLTMPRLDGRQVCQKICELRPNMPLILMSGYREPVFEGLQQQQEISATLDKPFGQQILSALVRQVLMSEKKAT